MEELNRLIREYTDLARTMKRESLLEKLAMDGKPGDSHHPAHEAFYEAVGAWAVEFAAGDPGQEALAAAVERLLFAAHGHENEMSCWYLLAIQGHAKRLIPLLEDGPRQQLRIAFEARYPRHRRLPVQDEICALLGKGNPAPRRGFFSFRK